MILAMLSYSHVIIIKVSNVMTHSKKALRTKDYDNQPPDIDSMYQGALTGQLCAWWHSECAILLETGDH